MDIQNIVLALTIVVLIVLMIVNFVMDSKLKQDHNIMNQNISLLQTKSDTMSSRVTSNENTISGLDTRLTKKESCYKNGTLLTSDQINNGDYNNCCSGLMSSYTNKCSACAPDGSWAKVDEDCCSGQRIGTGTYAEYCVSRCVNDTDCPQGYKCGSPGPGKTTCVPK